jgi:3'(2'), 5'-bisphosphate nucleotidase
MRTSEWIHSSVHLMNIRLARCAYVQPLRITARFCFRPRPRSTIFGPMDLRRELDTAVDLARRAGARIRALHGAQLAVDTKADDSPVTQADREANALIVDGITRAFPTDAVLSEEAPDDGSRHDHHRVWMVDPLDGTKDFIRGRDGFAVMIGLIEGDRPVLGVVYQPIGDNLYFAARGQGAFVQRDGDPIERMRVSDVTDPTQIRMVASKSHRTPAIDRVREELGISDELNVGSVGLKLGLISAGVRDLYVNPAGHSKLWDACGPEAILVEAGGRLTDLGGHPLDYRGRELGNTRGLIASNGHLHEQVVQRLAPLFAGGAATDD